MKSSSKGRASVLEAQLFDYRLPSPFGHLLGPVVGKGCLFAVEVDFEVASFCSLGNLYPLSQQPPLELITFHQPSCVWLMNPVYTMYVVIQYICGLFKG